MTRQRSTLGGQRLLAIASAEETAAAAAGPMSRSPASSPERCCRGHRRPMEATWNTCKVSKLLRRFCRSCPRGAHVACRQQASILGMGAPADGRSLMIHPEVAGGTGRGGSAAPCAPMTGLPRKQQDQTLLHDEPHSCPARRRRTYAVERDNRRVSRGGGGLRRYDLLPVARHMNSLCEKECNFGACGFTIPY